MGKNKVQRHRDDPNQTARARELAQAAGFDPDERVPKVGDNKTMPRWTLFIEQARGLENERRTKDEAIADAQRAAEAGTAIIPPQEERFKNAPLTIFGSHDQQTIDQMRACMSVGNVVGGVICADGHLGYAQPVGGVIAYQDQVSISGVGFDIGCVDAETEFLSSEGKWVRIDEWSNHQICIYDRSSGNGWFEKPQAYIKKPSEGFHRLKSKYGINQMLSSDHRMLLYVPGPEREFAEAVVMSAENFSNKHNSLVQGHDYRINTAFNLQKDSGLDMSDAMIRLAIAISADGHFERREGGFTRIAIVALKKERKILRMRELLHACGEWKFGENVTDDGYTVFRTKVPFTTKDLYTLLGKSGSAQLKIIAEESFHWDGNEEENVFFTRDKANADFMSYVYAATGKRSVMREDVDKSDGRTDYRVYAHSNTKTGMKAVPHNHIDFVPSPDGMEYCFTVSTGFFVIRRGGNVAITGNCGNMAVRLDVKYEDIQSRAPQILADIARVISFGVGRTNAERAEHALFDDADAWRASDMEEYRKKAVDQLGTVGSGNHYVDLMYDTSTGEVWIGVHFGSRGFGHTSATRYLKAAGGKDGMHVPPAVVGIDSELGQRYLAAMDLAGRYSYAGREWVVERVRQIIGGSIVDMVHNHHNFAFVEVHNGQKLFVVRKGATPAFPGQRGFVGGSMGDDAVILEGVDSPEARASFYSTVHGAGRLHGRKMAKRLFTKPQMEQWLKERGVLLHGGDIDEAPQAYRRLPDVLEAQGNTIKVLHRLRPFAVAMAGGGIDDPWRD